jgi:ABC-type oligopeptide transport system substrate-binding subunit
MRFLVTSFLALSLAACGTADEGGPIDVVFIGNDESLSLDGVRLSPAAQHLRSAMNEGLVAMDPAGEIIPAVAERWLVTDDGLSYIFRLRNSQWPGGEEISSAQVRRLLLDNIRRLRDTSLGYDLDKIVDVRAMTGRVIEINLSSPMPEFLRLLAQPELGFVQDDEGVGPMRAEIEEDGARIRLTSIPPNMRGLPAFETWEESVRQIEVRAMPAADAIDAFASGEIDLVLNGRVAAFPLVDIGPLSSGTIRLDAALGLFGLVIRSEEGLLALPSRREALSMAIDRSALIQPFNIDGWQSSHDIVPRALWGDVLPEAIAWTGFSMEQRRAEARGRIASWESASGEEARLTIGMPAGPGSDLLFRQISRDFAAIGIETSMTGLGQGADLELHDRVARYASPRWFLNQFNCSIRSGPCSAEADELVAQSLGVSDINQKATLLAQAELELQDASVFIPFGAPIRWALVRGNVEGFAENRWGIHPLFPLSEPPI